MRDPALRRAYRSGDWDIYPGQFFSSWNKEDIDMPSFEIPADWPIFGGLDYGESNPSSFGLYTVDFDGHIYRLAEYYQADDIIPPNVGNAYSSGYSTAYD